MLFYFEIVEQISLIVSRPLHFKEQNSSIIVQEEERKGEKGRGEEGRERERRGRERKAEEGRGRERKGRERRGGERKGRERKGEKGKGEEYRYLHSSILTYEITDMIQSATNYLLSSGSMSIRLLIANLLIL